MTPTLEQLRDRKAAARMTEIPDEVLAALNAGLIETKSLVEWLAIDQHQLLLAILPAVGLGDQSASLGALAADVATAGIVKRLKAIGRGLYEATTDRPDSWEALASHPSDMVRAWAAFAVSANDSLSFSVRLERLYRFAADPSSATRECAWDAWRPWFAQDIPAGIMALQPWVRDPDPNIRRCAIEGTRPRGVWTAHIGELKANPALGLPLLEPVCRDPSRYVQNAVGNWLNDASKSQPDWVRATTERWLEGDQSKATQYIVRRARRSLNKA